MAKRLDDNGVLYLLSKLLLLFVRSEPGKGLSQNDLTDSLKNMILNQFDGTWGSLSGKPSAVSAWTNDANYQSALQVSQAISTALAASGFQTAQQVETLIQAALSTLDTGIFVVVETLPSASAANPNKIYLAPAPGGSGDNLMEEWVAVNGKWEKLGSVNVSLDGYFNESKEMKEISLLLSPLSMITEKNQLPVQNDGVARYAQPAGAGVCVLDKAGDELGHIADDAPVKTIMPTMRAAMQHNT